MCDLPHTHLVLVNPYDVQVRYRRHTNILSNDTFLPFRSYSPNKWTTHLLEEVPGQLGDALGGLVRSRGRRRRKRAGCQPLHSVGRRDGHGGELVNHVLRWTLVPEAGSAGAEAHGWRLGLGGDLLGSSPAIFPALARARAPAFLFGEPAG